jgi:ubiquinone/menaquinone biosynthesis C-methylase UbiE
LPKFAKKIAYHLTGAKNSFTIDEYIKILSENCFIHHDLRTGIPMDDGVSEYVFSSHFLEHLYPGDAQVLLKDSYRVLKKGGRLRLSIPDLEFAIGLYPENKERMLKNYFFINNASNNFSNHKYMYDYDMIRSILANIGFQNILKSSYKASDFPDVERLDNRGEDSLFIEAIK